MEENENEGLNEELNNIEEQGDSLSNTDEAVFTTKERNENKILPIIATTLVGVVLIAVIVLVLLSLFSPKNTFFRLVNGSMFSVSKEISKFENSVLGKILAIDTTSKLNVDALIKGDIKTDNAEIKEWFQGLESFELNAKENIDFSNDYTDTTADFVLNGEEFLSGALVKNKNIISVKLDNVTDGYVTVDNNNLPALWEKIGYNGPDSLDNSADMLKDINFSKKDINNLKSALEKFMTGFFRVFDDDDFAYGEGTVTYDEGSIECKSMDFIVNAVDLNNGIIKGLEEIVGKDKYVDAIYKVISTLDKVSGYEPFSREEFGTNLEEMLEEIRSLEFTEEDTGFIIRIYYKGNDILKVEMRSEDYNTVLFDFTCINSRESGYYRFSDGMTVYEDKVTNIDKVTTHLITVDYIDYETGEILQGYGSEINITIDSTKKNEQIINLAEKVRLVSYDVDFETLDIMSITPTTVKEYTLKGSVDGDNNNIELIMIDKDDTYSSTFTVNASIKENAKFEHVSISEDENFDVSKKSDEEIITKKDKIISNWNANLGGDKNKMQQFEMAVSMYLSMFIPMDYYDYNEEDINLDTLDLEEL